MECEICVELFDNEDRTPLHLACKCHKILCASCIAKRLDSTARCPYCNIRWSIRNFLQQCRETTPPDMLEKLFDAHRIRIDSQTDHSHTDLGPGELRQYYEKSLLEVKRRAEEESAGQIEEDMIVAKALNEKMCSEAEEVKSRCRLIEANDAQMAARIAKETDNILNRSRLKGHKAFPKEYKNGIDKYMKKSDRSSITMPHSRTIESLSFPSQLITRNPTSSSSLIIPQKTISMKLEGREVDFFFIDVEPYEMPSSKTDIQHLVPTDLTVENSPIMLAVSPVETFSSSSTACGNSITTVQARRDFATHDCTDTQNRYNPIRNQNADERAVAYANKVAWKESHDFDVDGCIRDGDPNPNTEGWISSSSCADKTNASGGASVASIFCSKFERPFHIGLGTDRREKKEEKYPRDAAFHMNDLSLSNESHTRNLVEHSQELSMDTKKIIFIDGDKEIDNAEVVIHNTSKRTLDSSWSCTACTFDNTGTHASCAMCDRQRGGTEKKMKRDLLSVFVDPLKKR